MTMVNIATFFVLIVALFIAFRMFVMPIYEVWASRKRGEAQLAEAKFTEQIQIAEANARLAAAELNKRAELLDAEAVAKSIETIGDALKDNEGYLRWQWIRMMEEQDGNTIYVPTEAGLPILEAGKRGA